MSPEAHELKNIMGEYDLLDMEITIVGYCPDEGYFSYLFNYKNKYILLFDRGNGYYTFDREIADISLINVDYDLEGCGKISNKKPCKIGTY